MKLKLAALALGLTAATAVIAAKPADTISARQANFKVMGKSFKGILDELKAPAPSAAVFQANAAALAKAATKVAGGFPKGSGPESGAKTHALPVIWEKNPDFRAAAAKLVTASRAMDAAAKTGNVDQIKAAIPALGGSCKGCHETFKSKDRD